MQTQRPLFLAPTASIIVTAKPHLHCPGVLATVELACSRGVCIPVTTRSDARAFVRTPRRAPGSLESGSTTHGVTWLRRSWTPSASAMLRCVSECVPANRPKLARVCDRVRSGQGSDHIVRIGLADMELRFAAGNTGVWAKWQCGFLDGGQDQGRRRPRHATGSRCRALCLGHRMLGRPPPLESWTVNGLLHWSTWQLALTARTGLLSLPRRKRRSETGREKRGSRPRDPVQRGPQSRRPSSGMNGRLRGDVTLASTYHERVLDKPNCVSGLRPEDQQRDVAACHASGCYQDWFEPMRHRDRVSRI